jgi:RNA recognition motif-containing protein
MNIYIGNLSLNITEDDLRQEFVSFGKVTSVTLMDDLDIGSGQGRRCCYVEMPSIKEGESAIEQLQGKLLKGRLMDVIKALPVTKPSHNEPGADITAQGFGRKTRNWGSKKRK